jgi:hypothetical protein
MIAQINKWLNKNYPQNFIIEKPLIGTLIFLAFCYFFIVVYKPLNPNQARFFSLEFTIFLYTGSLSVPVFLTIKILKKLRYFSNPNEWTILKEIAAVTIVLSVMGIVLYFDGFLIELPSQRWNLATFFDSFKRGFLVGMIPFMFFTATNYRHLFITDIIRNFNTDNLPSSPEQTEILIRIVSRLKKEELSLYPSQLVYVESDGNYVVFYLHVENQVRKKIIRNSISNIEQQLTAIPFLVRTHRAFIVNIKQVASQKGNTLGYRLKLNGTDAVIPVSRQNTRDFDLLLKRYR